MEEEAKRARMRSVASVLMMKNGAWNKCNATMSRLNNNVPFGLKKYIYKTVRTHRGTEILYHVRTCVCVCVLLKRKGKNIKICLGE